MSTTAAFGTVEEFRAAAGTVLGHGDWLAVDQDRIDRFAEATGDRQWIHVDAERAAAGPFGTTVAHGYLTLSLLPVLIGDLARIDGVRMVVNYGLNRVRFPAPVPSGSRIRGVVELVAVEDVPGGLQSTLRVTVEREGGDKPVCVAEMLARVYP